MLLEKVCIEEVFLTEITPGMRKDLSSLVIEWIAFFYVLSQTLNMINALLSDEDSATLDAH